MAVLKTVNYGVLSVGIMLAGTCFAAGQLLQGGIVQSFPGINVVDGIIAPESDYGHAEIISCIESKLDVQIAWQSLPTDRLLKLTRENQLDLIYPMGYTEERNNYLQPTVWLTKDDDYFVFKTNTVGATDQAKNRTIGVKRGSPQQHYLQSHGYQNIHQIYEYPQLLPLLLMDRVEMLAVPQPLAEQLQAQLIAEQAQHTLQLYNYYTRDAGFYLAPAFASSHLSKMNNAVEQCRQFVKTVTAIK
ncbi:hypothetical protein WG68_01315 [Arsukibacterium ikkense]|uniref:Uncharacterized protein n=1 Tax=Arsukibacterium ikkense TaxID=336831 RepID=A0A0M2VDV1_9GAMM|nr:transporter substrate-binding domain-containing protein [Arsukibacterium ikkense]KKO47308.1 hypothetical protein WG68_01315 [Arsukibacterium ikkense]